MRQMSRAPRDERTTKAAKSEAQGAAHDHASACAPTAIAKRDQHSAMTEPRPVHVVGDSKSNSKISKKKLLYAELRLANGGTSSRGVPERCRASACGGIICDVSTSTSKSATPDNSPTVPTSSSDAATRCRDPQRRFSVVRM